MAGFIILLAISVFLVILIIRTMRFQPIEEEPVEAAPISVDREKIIKDMVSMIQCKTVSYREESLVDWQEFVKFQELLKERFPLVHEKCTLKKIGKTGLLYHMKGLSDKKPSVCMAHYDVVPVEEEGWSKPAFEGMIEDDVIWVTKQLQ